MKSMVVWRGPYWTVIGTLVTIGTFLRRRGVKPTGKSHSICRQHFLSAWQEKKQSARQKRDAHPRQTSRIVTFVYVFLTLFYAIFSVVGSHACCVEAYRVTCVYIFSTLWEFRSPRLRSLACMHASPFCGRNRSRPVCSQLVQAQWVRSAVSLACRTRNSWFTNPSEAWNHPNPTKHVGRVIDVCNTKDG